MSLKRSVVRAKLVGKYTVEAVARNHRIVMDIPKQVGGDDAGPTPVEVLLASLAGCIGIVARRHENRLGAPLEILEIVVEGYYDPRGFEGEDVKPGMQKMKVIVTLRTPADDEKLKEFMKFVEDHCPIEDTIKSVTDVEFELKRAA